MSNLKRFGANLIVIDNKVISYETHVATIEGSKLLVHGHWSKTTSAHITKVAAHYGLIKEDKPLPKAEDTSFLNAVGTIALMGEFFADTPKEKNDWKKRMISAGVPEGSISFPADWEELPEEEKERRLNKVIETFQS